MSSEQRSTPLEGSHATNTTSHGNSTVVSVLLFVVLFGLFAAGLYVMSLFTLWTFVIGVMMCIVALYLTFDLVPRLMSS